MLQTLRAPQTPQHPRLSLCHPDTVPSSLSFLLPYEKGGVLGDQGGPHPSRTPTALSRLLGHPLGTGGRLSDVPQTGRGQSLRLRLGSRAEAGIHRGLGAAPRWWLRAWHVLLHPARGFPGPLGQRGFPGPLGQRGFPGLLEQQIPLGLPSHEQPCCVGGEHPTARPRAEPS